jgi:predicted TIM-barrel fold metal-dependent hydrolase
VVVIDVHQHYADSSHYTDYADYPARLVDAMDRNGWDRVCLNGLGPAFHQRGNREVAAAAARLPDRIVGVGHLDPDRDKPGCVDDLKSMGMRGLKVIATLKRYDDDAYLPFYERAAALGMPILFHTGFLGGDAAAGPRDVSSDRYRPITLDRIARLFPGLPLIAAHLGTMTWYHEALAVMSHPNVYGDTSGGPGNMAAEFYRLPLNNAIDWSKMLFGSDSLPNDGHIPFGNLRRLMGELGLDDVTQQGVLGGTAARLYAV